MGEEGIQSQIWEQWGLLALVVVGKGVDYWAGSCFTKEDMQVNNFVYLPASGIKISRALEAWICWSGLLLETKNCKYWSN